MIMLVIEIIMKITVKINQLELSVTRLMPFINVLQRERGISMIRVVPAKYKYVRVVSSKRLHNRVVPGFANIDYCFPAPITSHTSRISHLAL